MKWQIRQGKNDISKNYSAQTREVLCRMLDEGYKTGDLRQLEKKHPGQIDKTPEYLKVTQRLVGLDLGAGSIDFSSIERLPGGGIRAQVDRASLQGKMLDCVLKLPSQTRKLENSDPLAAPKKRARKTKMKPEALEEDSFLIRVDDSSDELHGKVVDRLGGKGYTVNKGSSSSSGARLGNRDGRTRALLGFLKQLPLLCSSMMITGLEKSLRCFPLSSVHVFRCFP